MKEKPLSWLVFVVLLGMVLGAILGQAIGGLLPDSTPKSFLLGSYSPSFGFSDSGPFLIDLCVIRLKLGLQFTFNIISLVGMAVSIYFFRWYK
ncbi:MAG: hypothetical protein A2293_06005 [Elusimicrobia bacterium RIFOXYB2_FULL_49_7]|nr:MAG: hypothetical protein A2293_06005 [Elusimicrobia bacterium RIFOXYB2_FULL_49_7]